ncbi:TRAP transporter substrate-binding protein [Aquidulcibacter sp.]|jgi:tripartite ATP-independent transporter DctP family solute receptor|uniref:TRAP transporter substrate-binding protein n=1 Tax=Aquidulcibacter sp. TaxID=2052990 RepID=UPI0028A9F4A1|nr:TRAP transporter substrate-binding protein [Aquidulcibacter sp.]
MMNRRQIVAGSGLALAAGATGCSSISTRPVLTACDVHRDGYPTVKAVKWIGEQLATQTSNRLSLRSYPSAQLGAEDDTIVLAQSGVIDICRVNSAGLNNAFPLTQPLSMPFVVDGDDHLHAVCDGEVGKTILQGFEARGLVGLAIYDAGGRCFYNTHRPVEKPSDLKGMKIRVPQSDVFIDAVAAMGANPTPLTVSAVYSSLQSRLIDGAENNWPTFETSRHVEVAKYWSQTKHSYSPEFLLMSKHSYNSLQPADRDLVRELARQSVSVMRTAWVKTEAEAKEKALGEGTLAIDVNRAAFQAACRPAVDARLTNEDVRAVYTQIRGLA